MGMRTVEIPRHSFTGNGWERSGVYRIQAESAAGHFWVYPSKFVGLAGGWTLTHKRSGKAVRHCLKSRNSARGLAGALRQFRWDFVLVPGAQGMAQIPRGFRGEMRKAAKIAGGWERQA